MKSYQSLFVFAALSILLNACIKDDIVNDFVEPQISITTSASEIAEGESFDFNALFLNNVGVAENVEKQWTSSDETVATVDSEGLVTALTKGQTWIMVSHYAESIDNWYRDSVSVNVSEMTVEQPTVKQGTLATTSHYTLQGDFTFVQLENGDLQINIDDNYKQSSNLPGPYVYLSNNPNTTSGALEISRVTVFEGAHSYTVKNVDINDYKILLYYCKPFNSKIGDGVVE